MASKKQPQSEEEQTEGGDYPHQVGSVNYGGPLPPVPPGYQPPSLGLETIFGKYPVQLRCSNCQVNMRTGVEYKIGTYTWFAVMIYMMFGCFIVFPFFLAWIPLCQKSLKDVVHSCPMCRIQIGRYRHL